MSDYETPLLWNICLIVFMYLCVVRLLVCDQDNTKTSEWISTILEWRMGLGPEWTLLTFDTDPNVFIIFLKFC